MARKKREKWLDPDRYIDTKTLAAMLGLSVRTLHRRIEQGVIPPPTHPGRPNRFDVHALIAHVEQRDPWLSCQLAGGVGRWQGYAAQSRKLWRLPGWRRWTDPDGTTWATIDPPGSSPPGSARGGLSCGERPGVATLPASECAR